MLPMFNIYNIYHHHPPHGIVFYCILLYCSAVLCCDVLYLTDSLSPSFPPPFPLLPNYKVCLDEKRNYWAFILSTVSIATFPFSVMTGYFGMNFENMSSPGAVLTDDYWKLFPGKK